MSGSPILQSVSVRAICPNGFVWSYRTRAPVGLKTETFLETSTSRASTIFQSASAFRSRRGVIAAASSIGSVLARGLKRIISLSRIASGLFLFQLVAGRTRDIMRPAFPTLGTIWSGICNWCRAQLAHGGLSFSRVAFVNDCRQPANRIARTLSFTPVLTLPSAHDLNMQQKDGQDHGKITRKHG